jgi:hypothetical protein
MSDERTMTAGVPDQLAFTFFIGRRRVLEIMEQYNNHKERLRNPTLSEAELERRNIEAWLDMTTTEFMKSLGLGWNAPHGH